MPVRVAIADDHALVRRGLRSILEADEQIEIVLEVSDGEALMAALATTDIDLVLSDIRMPRLDGISVVNRLRRGANRLPVILLTSYGEGEYLERCVQAGANAYLLKDVEPEVLIEAVHKVAAGEKYLQPQPTHAIREHASLPVVERDDLTFSDKELATLRLMAAGLGNKAIANNLNLAEGTVKNRVSEILAKLAARDRTHAVLLAISRGVI